MAETFPLPRSSSKLLRLILIGYLHEGGNARKPAGPADVGRTVGLDRTLVSRNNAALAALGLVESAEARRWRLTDGGVEVARALEYESDNDLRESLGEVFRSNPFIQRIATFVRAQGGVDENEAVFHMAKTAGVKRTSEFLTGARALLELMLAAGILESEGDLIRVPPPSRDGDATERPAPKKDEPHPLETSIFGGGGVSYRTEPKGAAPGITLHLNLSPGDLKTDAAADELAARIKRLLDALRSG